MLRTTIPAKEGITLKVKLNHRPRVVVRADRGRVPSRWPAAGGVGRQRSGPECELSRALAPLAQRVWRHDPARVLAAPKVALATGGEGISDLAVLRQQPELIGEMASDSTA